MKTRLIFLAVVVCGLLRVSAQSIVINLQPTNQVVAANGTVNLSVVASSTYSLFYQWWKDNVMLAGATNATLSLANAGVTNSGVYYVVITNAARAMAISYPADVAVGNPSLLAWGYNSYGQLGNGNNVSARWPIVVTSNVVAVAVGASQISGGDTFEHSLFVKSDGTLWAMGYNGYGQLGIGTYNSTNVPVYVTSNVVSVAAGASHSLFVKSDGTLWAMGWNNYGQLGNGSAVTQTNVPVYVTNNVVSAAAGGYHSLFVKNDGTLWAMGINADGELGNGTSTGTTVPVYVTNNVVSVAAGFNHSLFVRSDGKLWGMGLNYYGELATSLIHNTTVPICISSNVVSVAAGCWSTLFVKSDGKLWGVGWNHYGDLGIGSTSEQDSPVCMSSNVVSVAAGDNYSMFVKRDGTLWTTGWNNNDQLGSGLASAYIAVPIMVHSLGVASLAPGPIGNHTLEVGVPFNPFINSQPASQVVTNGGTVNLSVVASSAASMSYQWWKDSALLAGATNAALSLTNAGVTNSGVYYVVITNTVGGITISFPADVAVGSPSLLAWGHNNYGQLGNGTYNNTNLPITVMSNVVSAASGDGFSLFVKSDGTLWAMGGNGNGELGNGTTINSNVPVYVTSNVVSAAAGGSHSLFLKSDGTLWTMGYNYYGQLGNGTATDSSVPVFVTNNVVSMAAGAYHSLFLMSDGTLWGMGDDSVGELGPSGNWRTATPVYVTNNVVMVASGGFQTLFVKGDGTLWGMGWNNHGELGLGDLLQQPYPACVMSNVVAVAAGGSEAAGGDSPEHSLVVKSDGTLWAMGADAYGQLGNGSTTDSHVPVYVTNHVASVSAGAYHSLFMKSDGTLWAMGYNYYGQLGNGSTTDSHVPVKAYSLGVVSLAFGSGTYHALEVGVSVAPAISAQPASQIVPVGTSVAFSVTATGTIPLSYQWFFGGSAINGAISTNYVMTNVLAASSGNYTVVIANIFGSVTSSAASLTVVPLTINLQPTNQAVTNGGTVTLSVVITNSPAAVSYQWWKDGAMVPGATNATLSLTNAGVTNSGVYYAVATNLCGMMAISSPADVTVGGPSLLAWGNNNYGQLGIGSSISYKNVPLTVVSNVVSAAVGSSHSLFVKSDGTLWAMGTNGYGQLGNGTTNSTNVPVYVTNNLVSVAAGQNHSLFLKNDGTLWAMGTNGYGQLGNGTTNNASVPVYVTNNVVSAAAGAGHSLFVKSDGTMWAMGQNTYGQLGIGSLVAKTNVPVYVTNNVAGVAAGGNSPATNSHSLFVKSDGTMWAMGGNGYGQLGNGTTNNATVPVYVTNNVMSVTAGQSHSLFLKSDGTLWAMGYNAYGQLGNGSTNNRTVPVKAYSAGVANLAFGPAANHTLEAGVPLPPVITAQPTSQTVPAGANLTISMGVVGYSPLSFQWFFGGSAIGGATNSSYAMTNVLLANSGNYLVVITNIFGSVTSSVASLTVNRATPLVATVGATAITYGQTLGNSAVMGTMTNAGGGTVGGVFAFANTTLAPFAGTTNVSYTFAPADTTNYNSMTGTVSVVVSPATAAVTLGSLAQTYDGTAKNATATTAPAGLLVNLTHDGSANAPTNAGSYAVVGTISDANYAGSSTNTLVISKATATVTLGSLAQIYTGSALNATATTVPAGLTVNLTCNGSANAPTNAGSYAVAGTISDANYSAARRTRW